MKRTQKGFASHLYFHVFRLRDPRTVALRDWTTRIATRREKKIAVVALARWLAGKLYAMLRDSTP